MVDRREESRSKDVAARTRTLDHERSLETVIGERSLSRAEASARTPRPSTQSPPALRVAGRYELVRTIGSGGFGTVYEAMDLALEQRVAVKLLEPKQSGLARFPWREASLLRSLRLPGVVELRDEGLVHDRFYLVMELVDGSRFPGPDLGRRPVCWEQLGPRFLRLLTILSAVHREGVIHRDLKPSNILVRPDGHLRLLDFGVSWDRHHMDLSNDRVRLVGTPAYLAPEQWRGLTPSRQTDIWALGVILFEALAGRRPFPHPGQRELRNATLREDAPSLGAFQPDLPEEVIRTVDRMLSRDPKQRPSSVEDVARMLEGRRFRARPRLLNLPLAGRDEIIVEALQIAQSGTPVRLTGPPGSGRSRTLAEIEVRLIDLDVRVRRLTPASQPWGSLAELQNEAGEERHELDADRALELLTRFRDQQGVLLVDEPGRLDSATVALLRHAGTGLRVISAGSQPLFPEDKTLPLPDLSPESMEAFFRGPRRFLRLPQRAAQELYRRTGGRPMRVSMELQAWLDAEVAERSEEGIRIDESALARLRGGLPVPAELSLQPRNVPGCPEERQLLAWAFLAQPLSEPEAYADLLSAPVERVRVLMERLDERGFIVRNPGQEGMHVPPPPLIDELDAIRNPACHAALAAHLPAHSPKRLYHLLEANALEDAASLAMELAQSWDQQGMVGQTQHLLVDTLRALRRTQRFEEARALLTQLTYVAVLSNELHAIEACLNECAQLSDELGGSLSRLEKLLVVLRLVHMKSEADLLERLRTMPPFGDPRIEFCRRSGLTQALRFRKDLEGWSAHIEDCVRWAQLQEDPEFEGACIGWHGAVLSRKHRYRDAANAHLRGAGMKRRPSARISSLLNAGIALLNAGEDPALVRARLVEAQQAAHQCEHAHYDALATIRIRMLDYRVDRPGLRADPEIIDALRYWDHGDQLAYALGIEAAIAWRSGEPELAAALADEAMRTWLRCGHQEMAMLWETLCLICTGTSHRPLDEIMGEALKGKVPYISIQVIALCAEIRPLRPAEADALLRLLDEVPEARRTHRLDILSWSECGQAGRPGSPGIRAQQERRYPRS